MERSSTYRRNLRPAQKVEGGPQSAPKVAESVDEFCHSFGIGRTLFYAQVKAGAIRTVKVGKRTLVPIAERDAFLARICGEVA
jgi:hypothetical protein